MQGAAGAEGIRVAFGKTQQLVKDHIEVSIKLWGTPDQVKRYVQHGMHMLSGVSKQIDTKASKLCPGCGTPQKKNGAYCINCGLWTP